MEEEATQELRDLVTEYVDLDDTATKISNLGE